MDVFDLYEAIGEIDYHFLQEPDRSKKREIRLTLKHMVAACLIFTIVSIPVQAEYQTGYISNLLSPIYGSQRTELTESIGIPLGANITVGGYTLSAEAMIGDRYNICVLYSLVQEDGEPLPTGIQFSHHNNSLSSGTGGGSVKYSLSEDGTRLNIVEYWRRPEGYIFDRYASVEFEKLAIYDEHGMLKETIADGTWKLSYVLRYKDESVKIDNPPMKGESCMGNTYIVDKIIISPISIHLDLRISNPYATGDFEIKPMYDITVAVLLRDHTSVNYISTGGHLSGAVEDELVDADFDALFDTPVNIADIEAIIVCGNELEVR